MTKPKKRGEKKSPSRSKISDVEVAKKLINIYQSALDRKIDFDLSFESIKTLLQFPTCYYTGRTFDQEGPYSRSIDRIDSSKGYIEGNVVSCTIDINGKKSNLSEEEIEILYTKIVLPRKTTPKKNQESEKEPYISPESESTENEPTED